MKLFLDTNILVYSVFQNSPKYKEASKFIMHCLSENVTCYFLSSSLKDVYYILCRHYLSEPDARQCIKLLCETLDMVELNSMIIDKAFDCNEPDFEDALIRSAAEVLQVNAMVSYDKNAFENSFVPRFTAKEILKELEKS